MTEHIDHTRLNSDLHYRFEYLSKFLDFTHDDIARLNILASIIFPRIPVIVDTAYRKLFSFDITKQYFILNQSFENFSPHINLNLVLDSAQMTYRKDMLSMYLKRVLTQHEWNDTFLQYLSEIGKIHTNKISPSSLHVDYMHINALLGYLEHLFIDLLWKTETIEEKNKCHMIMTINKLFWIQNDFFTRHYMMKIKENLSLCIITKKESESCCILS